MCVKKHLSIWYHKYLRMSKEGRKIFWILDVTGGVLIGAGIVGGNGFMVLWGIMSVYASYHFVRHDQN